jgi:ribosome biogenesis GTPase / thiamine phosphate phosphatase
VCGILENQLKNIIILNEKIGIVVRSTGSWYSIRENNGNVTDCKLKGNYKIKGIKSTNPIAVGDKVSFSMLPDKEIGLIHKIFDRKNYIIRKSTNLSKKTHILASNLDQVFLIITIANPRTSSGFIDRFLVNCEAFDIPCTLVINKIDLIDEVSSIVLKQFNEIYSNIGYKIIETSAVTGFNIDVLKNEMVGKTSLFAGHSGVGKSAILNTIDPRLELREGETSDVHLKGKHTTTNSDMYYLDFDAFIIDTPGIKEFGLTNFSSEEIGHYFPEIIELMNQCKFNNCTHEHEPGCVVKEAVELEKISMVRYINYLNIMHGEEMKIPDYE